MQCFIFGTERVNKDLPPFVSSLLSKNILRSPAKTVQFFLKNVSFMRSQSSAKTCTCSTLLLAL